jgi:hypothetical protein
VPGPQGIQGIQGIQGPPGPAPIDALAFNGLQINGAMEISQERGTAVLALASGSGQFVLDLWTAAFQSGVAAFQTGQAAHGDLALPMMPQCISLRATTAMSSVGATEYTIIYTQFEGYRIKRLGFGTAKAMPITLGFWVKASIPGTLAMVLRNGAAANRSYVVDLAITAANVFEYKKVTIPGDTTGTWLQANQDALFAMFSFACGSNFQTAPGAWVAGNKLGTANTTNFFATANNQVQVTGFSAFAGIDAPDAAHSHLVQRTSDEEITRCARCYQKSYPYDMPPGTITDNGKSLMIWTAGGGYHAWPITYATRMRSPPTIMAYSNATGAANRLRDDTNAVDRAASISASSEVGFSVYTDLGGTAVAALGCQWVADARSNPSALQRPRAPSEVGNPADA